MSARQRQALKKQPALSLIIVSSATEGNTAVEMKQPYSCSFFFFDSS